MRGAANRAATVRERSIVSMDHAHVCVWGFFRRLAIGLAFPVAAYAQWPQFGGPNRNFTVDAKGLADNWPDSGPKQLWRRDLGDGYSTIVSDGDRLYTMYRVGDDEFTVALDPTTGKTIWEHKNPSPFTPMMTEYGPGPHATPLLVDNRLYTLGTNAVLHAFDKGTGRVLWKHDLPAEFGAPVPEYGYSASPIAYKNTIILTVDRKRIRPGEGDAAANKDAALAPAQTLMAFDQLTGNPVWKGLDFESSYSSPTLIRFEGEDQLVLFTTNEIVGVNPATGEMLWSFVHKTQYGANLSSPIFNGKDLLFCSAAYDSGSRVVKLTKKGGKTSAEEVWFSRKMRLHHGNAVQLGDYVYGSSGDFGPAFFMGLEMRTGNVLWRERGFSKTTCISADGKLFLLDEDGNLALATASTGGLTVHSKAKLFEKYAWTAPTLVGKTLYVRDRKHIAAYDVGKGS